MEQRMAGKRKRGIRALTAVLIAALVCSGVAVSGTNVAATKANALAGGEPLPYVKAGKGLWITEIYQNDVNRSAVYVTTSDLMEFVEIVNTGDTAVDFNAGYTLWYEYLSAGKLITQADPLTITGDDDGTVLAPGETVIIRDARPDIAQGGNPEQYPSDEAFRQTMDVPSDVRIWKAAGQNGWAENCRGFSLRLKSDKETVLSRYIYNFQVDTAGAVTEKTDDVTADGLSVSLQIPDFGYEMLAWEPKSIPTPGYVCNEQYNGQKTITPPESAPQGLFITEILPYDASSVTSARFGSGGNQILEFVELTNTTGKDIDLNKEYQLTYASKTNNGVRNYSGGNERLVVVTQPDDPYNGTCVIEAGETVVIWLHREEGNSAFLKDKYGVTMSLMTQIAHAAPGVTTTYETWPTLAEFREIRGIPESVTIFTARNINGAGNERNRFSLRKILNPDAVFSEKVTEYPTALVSSYKYDVPFKKDVASNRSVQTRVSVTGPHMETYQASAVPSPGVVDPHQTTYLADDGQTPVIREWEMSPVPASIEQGDFFRTPYYYESVKSVELFYKTSHTDSFSKTVSTSFSIYNKWYTFIPSDVLLHADYFDYYIKAKGVYRSVQTDMKRVKIDKINDATGLRVSLDGVTAAGAETVSGTLNVTAKNFDEPGAPVTMALDGENLPVSASFEKGAFFTFTHDGGNGLDGYFKNALVVKAHEDDDSGEILKLFPAYSEVPGLSSMAIRVDSRYFTFNPDGSAQIDLYVYAGTNGSTFESFTSENNDDFTVQWARLSLPDGTTLKPTEYKGYRVAAGEGGAGTAKLGWFNLDPDTQVSVGDSNNLHVYVKASFTVPAGKLDAYAAGIDTTRLSDGAHSLVVTSGALSKTVTLNAGNSAPVPEEPERLPATDLCLSLDAGQSPARATVTARDGDKTIAIYEAKQADIRVYEGTGDSTATAAEKSDTAATVSTGGEFPYQIYELTVAAEETDSLRFDITATSDYGRDVRLYALNVQDDVWELLQTTRSGGEITAIFPLANRLRGDQVKVLAQARGTEFAPYTGVNTPRTVKNNYPAEWTGAGEHAVPKQYDFSMAWVTDTQYYAEQYHSHFENIVDWIVEKKDELNIKYVPHTGDIVDEWDEEDQFIRASDYLKKFEDAAVPYGVIAGNHDVAHGAEKYDLYWKYFGENRYRDNSYYGGSYQNNLGHYDLVTVDGVEMIFVYMSWDIYYPETDWINEVLAKYADRKAIVAVHCGINASAAQSYQSRLLLNEVCAKNKNVFAMINGHYHGSALNFQGFDDDGDGAADRVVYQLCTDYQSAPEGGNGYIKMLYFDLANDKIYINSYSPSLNDYNYYDTPKLAEYPIGLNIYNIDITELDVDFDRETVKTLTASGAEAAVLTDTRLGSAPADGETVIALGSAPGAGEFAYAVATDADGAIAAYSRAVALGDNPTPTSLRVVSDADGKIIGRGDSFNVDTAFSSPVSSNAAVLTFAYDKDKFVYKGYTAPAGVTLLTAAIGDNEVRLTLMVPGYSASALGKALFAAKTDADLGSGESDIDVTVQYVLKASDGTKTVETLVGSTSVYASDKKPDLSNVTLITLSDAIEVFGLTSSDPNWGRIRHFDMNGNSVIDIGDIAHIARLVK